MSGPGPIDTIREALTTEGPYLTRLDAALAALTEVEHQLAAPGFSLDEMQQVREAGREAEARAVAAETALAEAQANETAWSKTAHTSTETAKEQRLRAEAAEQRANDLSAALARCDETAGDEHYRRVTAEAERDALADALREAVDTLAYVDTDTWRDRVGIARPDAMLFRARAALDQQEQR